MKGNNFMFINKTAKSDSLSHSNKQERIQIHSHVQRGRRYKNSEGGIIYAAQLPFLQPGRRARPNADGEHGDDNDNSLQASSKTQPSSLYHTGRRRTPEQYQHFESPDPNMDPLLWGFSSNYGLVTKSPQAIPIFPATAEDNFDPFDVTCVKVDEAVHSLLQYFLRVHHPNIWHLERAVRPDHAYEFRHDAMDIIQGCLHDEYNMYALLACMASYMTYLDGIPSSGDGNLYIHRALKAAQNYVQSRLPITGRMIWNIFNLGCAEWYRYNVDAAYVHLKAAKSMVDSIGGLKSLEGPLVELLLTGDGYVAAELRKKPLWSDSDFDSGDTHPMTTYGLQELQKLLSGSVQTGSGLLTSAQGEIVPPRLRWVILDLAVVLSVLKSSQSFKSKEEPQAPGGLHWVHIRSLAIRQRLLHLDLEDARSDAVRTGLVLWIFMAFTVAGRKRSTKVVAPFLRQTLDAIPEEQWDGHEEVHLWVLSIGAISVSLETEDHVWFVARIKALAIGDLGSPESIFDAFVNLSDKFFYLETAQKYNLRALADDVHHALKVTRKSKTTSAPKSPNP